MQAYGDYKKRSAKPADQRRNDMYVHQRSPSPHAQGRQPKFNPDEKAALNNYKSKVDKATKFIPAWVRWL